MMQFLETVEQSGIATWVRESPSIFAYTMVLSLHAIGLSIVVGISSMVGLRLAGAFRSIPAEPLFRLFPVMYAGFTINLVSGLLLLMANATGMLTMLMFYLKIVFVIAAMGALELMRMRFSAGDGDASLRRPAIALLVFWFLAIVSGRLVSYPYMVQAWFGG